MDPSKQGELDSFLARIDEAAAEVEAAKAAADRLAAFRDEERAVWREADSPVHLSENNTGETVALSSASTSAATPVSSNVGSDYEPAGATGDDVVTAAPEGATPLQGSEKIGNSLVDDDDGAATAGDDDDVENDVAGRGGSGSSGGSSGGSGGSSGGSVGGTQPAAGQMDAATFMSAMEQDAADRAERRAAAERQALSSKERGNAAFRAGDYAGAIAAYTEGTGRAPHLMVNICNRAQAYLRLGEWASAAQDATGPPHTPPPHFGVWVGVEAAAVSVSCG